VKKAADKARSAATDAAAKAAAAGAGIAAMATKAAAQGADSAQSTAPKGKAKAKDKSKTKESKGEPKETPKDGKKEAAWDPVVEEPVAAEELVVDPVILKAALRIQAYYRGWKARRVVKGVRQWKPNQKVCLYIDCISGKDMPSVNTFGGCDPFVEFRLVQGQDPILQKGGGAMSKAPEGMSFKTEPDDGNMNPTWNAKFEIKEVPLRKDQFLQVILWDKNTFTDTAIGHQTFMVEKLLEGLSFVAGTDQPKRNAQKVSFQSLLEDQSLQLKATIQTKFSYVDMVKFSFTVMKGSRLPSVKMFGGINSYVELRIETKDPKKNDFESSPTSTCLWSSKTPAVKDSLDPKYDHNFDVVLPATAALKLQVIIWDSNAPMPDSPICHSLMDLSGLVGEMPKEPKEHKLRFAHLPGVAPTGDVRKTVVAVAIGVSQAFDQEVNND